MPAEFEPHSGCWMLWPERPTNWRDAARPAQDAFVAVALAIATSETVFVGASPSRLEEARRRLPANVEVVELSSDDAWMRDVGPTIVTNPAGERRAVCWRFNAWGGLYRNWSADEMVSRKVAAHMGMQSYRAPIILEGGSFHVDGLGTLITTEECLLHSSRNTSLDRTQLEELLGDYLDIKKIIWLPRGLDADETHGHVDNLCCFSNVGEVVLAWTDDPSDANYERCHDAYRVLTESHDARGQSLVVHRLPLPPALFRTPTEAVTVVGEGSMSRRAGERLTASYLNFYIGNQCVVVPQFNVAADEDALGRLAAWFPGRRIIGIPSREILLGGGNIHCITQQVPAGC